MGYFRLLFNHIKNHKYFFMLTPIIIAIMTYPSAFHILGGEGGGWLPSPIHDVYMKLWDTWYLGEMLFNSQNFYFTSNLFYPDGLSLVYHNFSLPHMIIMSASMPFFGQIGAYNFTNLVNIFAIIYAGYLYIFHLTQDKRLSIFGSFMCGLSSFILVKMGLPDLISLAPIPLVLLYIDKGFRETRLRHFISAGTVLGLTVFISMYVYVCAIITLSIYLVFLFIEVQGLDKKKIGLYLLTFGIVVAIISLIRVYPMLINSDALDAAVNKSSVRDSELMSYFTNIKHYLGYIPFILIFFGLLHSPTRPKMYKWLIIALIFGILRLGPELTVNGVVHKDIVLPKKFLDDVLPMIFRPFHNVGNFSMGLALPMAILSTYGLTALLSLKWLGKYSSLVLIILILTIGLYERFNVHPGVFISDEDIAFYVALKQDNEDIALINIPMNRKHSKVYSFYQTIHNFPHAEGAAARTPSEAYRYINNNLLLSAWKKLEVVQCTSKNADQYKRDLNSLIDNKFKYIIIHKRFVENKFYENFHDIDRADETRFVNVYAVADLAQTCPTKQ